MKLVPYLITHKINTEGINGLIINPEAIKLPEENRGEKFLGIGLTNDFVFFARTPKAHATKTKVNKWDDIKLKTSCTAKETKK